MEIIKRSKSCGFEEIRSVEKERVCECEEDEAETCEKTLYSTYASLHPLSHSIEKKGMFGPKLLVFHKVDFRVISTVVVCRCEKKKVKDWLAKAWLEVEDPTPMISLVGRDNLGCIAKSIILMK